ncbi:MAG TPA: PfkB family carbohydrate kinase [Actinoplanes sp.]
MLDVLRTASTILVSDYGRGVARHPEVRAALTATSAAVVWDPHPNGPAPVPGVRLVTPNEAEARTLTGDAAAGSRLSTATRTGQELCRRWRAGAVVVTMGADGAVLCQSGPTPLVVPVPVAADGDTCGAGDRFAAAAAVALAGGALVSEAVEEAVAQAAAYVAAGGVATALAALTGPRIAAPDHHRPVPADHPHTTEAHPGEGHDGARVTAPAQHRPGTGRGRRNGGGRRDSSATANGNGHPVNGTGQQGTGQQAGAHQPNGHQPNGHQGNGRSANGHGNGHQGCDAPVDGPAPALRRADGDGRPVRRFAPWPPRAGEVVPGERIGADATGALLADVRAGGGTVVATGGCFDLLHAGHVATLQAARRLGDCLVVCLNSDTSVAGLKGPDRPVTSQADRSRLLAALGCVDAVVIFDEPTPESVLTWLRPDVWVKGGDYADGGPDLPEAELVRRWGGQTVVVPYLDGRSTTRMIAAVRAGDEQSSTRIEGA